jgi:tRNA threonylcarbamoyladenosine biosynthesis protein TsaB
MIVLGIDTATAATAVALARPGESALEARDDPPAGAHPGHATRLLEMAHGLLGEAGIGWGEIERIAVGAGPGTFTGLRVGIATARGLAQSLGAELVAVSSLRALAEGALTAGADPAATLAVIDARRGEVFAAAYGADGSELTTPRALAPERIGELLGEAGLRDGDAPAAVGDGAVRYRPQLEGAGLLIASDSSPLHLLRGAAVCELGLRGRPGSGYGQVLPDYRRRPDAELALEGAAAGDGGKP